MHQFQLRIALQYNKTTRNFWISLAACLLCACKKCACRKLVKHCRKCHLTARPQSTLFRCRCFMDGCLQHLKMLPRKHLLELDLAAWKFLKVHVKPCQHPHLCKHIPPYQLLLVRPPLYSLIQVLWYNLLPIKRNGVILLAQLTNFIISKPRQCLLAELFVHSSFHSVVLSNTQLHRHCYWYRALWPFS